MAIVRSRHQRRSFLLISLTSLAAISSFSASNAAVAISSDPTQNMACSAGVCSPTASDAVLNASDLEAMLASGDLAVTTTGSGVQANDIDLETGVSWSNGSSLSLDSYQSIVVGSPMSVQGQGNMSLVTNDGGTEGRLSFAGIGAISFDNLSSTLSINSQSFVLVNSISTLASAIAGNPSGNFALASSYDAKQDGTYSASPISTTFAGTFEGLGNVILNLSVFDMTGRRVGFFAELQKASISDVGLSNVFIVGDKAKYVGGLVGDDEAGVIEQSSVTGLVGTNRNAGAVGGLAGYVFGGSIDRSWSAADASGGASAGGLVGIADTGSVVKQSYAGGRAYAAGLAGGLVGANSGALSDSYAGGESSHASFEGGLVGENFGTVARSYSFGVVAAGATYAGGLIGYDAADAGSLAKSYWDRTSSGIYSKSQGAGNIADDHGIRGKTTKQLKAGLPKGFSPKIWGENAKINRGLPYLLANPPLD